MEVLPDPTRSSSRFGVRGSASSSSSLISTHLQSCECAFVADDLLDGRAAPAVLRAGGWTCARDKRTRPTRCRRPRRPVRRDGHGLGLLLEKHLLARRAGLLRHNAAPENDRRGGRDRISARRRRLGGDGLRRRASAHLASPVVRRRRPSRDFARGRRAPQSSSPSRSAPAFRGAAARPAEDGRRFAAPAAGSRRPLLRAREGASRGRACCSIDHLLLSDRLSFFNKSSARFTCARRAPPCTSQRSRLAKICISGLSAAVFRRAVSQPILQQLLLALAKVAPQRQSLARSQFRLQIT